MAWLAPVIVRRVGGDDGPYRRRAEQHPQLCAELRACPLLIVGVLRVGAAHVWREEHHTRNVHICPAGY